MDVLKRYSMNRLGNCSNRAQGETKRVLCVCSAGLLRSPTTAWVLGREPFNFNCRAVGTEEQYALVPLDHVHVLWADVVIVQESYQQDIVEQLKADLLEQYGMRHNNQNLPVHCLNIHDSYRYRDKELVNLIFDKCFEIFFSEEL